MVTNWVKTAALVGLTASSLFAGGATTNNNHSAAFLRSVARNATLENDAPYYNPAGTAFIKDGFHLSLSNQTFWQGRTITTESPLFNDGEKKYKGNTFAPFMPGVHATWHYGNLALSATVGIIGGGGSLNFKDGIPSFDTQLAALPMMLTQAGLPTTSYEADIKLEAESYQVGVTLGAAYQFANMFSIYAGGRLTYSYNNYQASLSNVKFNPKVDELGLDGKMVEAAATFNKLSEALGEKAEQANSAAEQYEKAGDKATAAGYAAVAEELAAKAEAMAGYAYAVGDKELDVEQEGFGFAPIFGAAFKYKRLTIGVKYEMKTDIEMENDTKKNEVGMSDFDDGKKDHADVPAVLALGLTYSILDNARISFGYNLWFDEDADLTGNSEDFLGNSHEFMYGVEIDFFKRWTISGGLNIFRCDRTDDYVSDLSQLLNTTTFGLGFAYRVNDHIRIDVGYYHTIYNDDTDKESYGLNTYERTSRGFGIGVDLDF